MKSVVYLKVRIHFESFAGETAAAMAKRTPQARPCLIATTSVTQTRADDGQILLSG